MSSEAPPLVVVCLCAAWCGVCRDYAATFDAVVATLPAVRALRLDVEDDAEAVGELDVVDFPTLLVGRAGELLFIGPVTPQPTVLAQLLRRALAGGLAPIGDAPAAAAVLARLAAQPASPASLHGRPAPESPR